MRDPISFEMKRSESTVIRIMTKLSLQWEGLTRNDEVTEWCCWSECFSKVWSGAVQLAPCVAYWLRVPQQRIYHGAVGIAGLGVMSVLQLPCSLRTISVSFIFLYLFFILICVPIHERQLWNRCQSLQKQLPDVDPSKGKRARSTRRSTVKPLTP